MSEISVMPGNLAIKIFQDDVSRIITKYSLQIVHKDIYDNIYSNQLIKLI